MRHVGLADVDGGEDQVGGGAPDGGGRRRDAGRPGAGGAGRRLRRFAERGEAPAPTEQRPDPDADLGAAVERLDLAVEAAQVQ